MLLLYRQIVSYQSTVSQDRRVLHVSSHVKYYYNVCIQSVNMGKFSLARLIMCAKYQRLTSDDYLRLGLCLPDQCQDCASGQGHYVKNDKMVS